MTKDKIESIRFKEICDLLKLAENCKFITDSQGKEIQPLLPEYVKKHPDDHAAQFFVKKKILSKEKITHLIAIKKQLDTLMADKKFGKLGVANQFVTRESVQKALDIQVAIFRKEKKSVKIGDILVNNKEISVANKTAILLTQDRVRDELLADAINAIATSKAEKDAINKRFGAIAVKKNLISTDQLNQALRTQNGEMEAKGENRYLGEILKEQFDVSQAGISEILAIQKKMETKRLNLHLKMNHPLNSFFDPGNIKFPVLSEEKKMQGPVTKRIEGDIVVDTADADTILKVDGNIGSGVHVSCHQLIIKGDIQGNVTASGNIDVNGNIGVRPKADDDVFDPVFVSTKGSLRVTHNIMNAQIVAFEGVNAKNSDVVSSMVFSSRDIVVKNIYSTAKVPSTLRIVRENYPQIEKINKNVKKMTGTLDKISHKTEMDRLTSQLMEQVQIQNGIMEKQNVILYLKQILEDPDLKNSEDLAGKADTYEKKNKAPSENGNQIAIPENTKAYKFMKIILDKIQEKKLKDQEKYIRDLYENISDMHRAAVKNTEKINKKYEVRSKEIEAEIEKIKPVIDQKKEMIQTLLTRKKFLVLNQEKAESNNNPVIRIKNQISEHTIIQGENAVQSFDQTIYGVSIREDYTSSDSKSNMRVKGYFE